MTRVVEIAGAGQNLGDMEQNWSPCDIKTGGRYLAMMESLGWCLLPIPDADNLHPAKYVCWQFVKFADGETEVATDLAEIFDQESETAWLIAELQRGGG